MWNLQTKKFTRGENFSMRTSKTQYQWMRGDLRGEGNVNPASTLVNVFFKYIYKFHCNQKQHLESKFRTIWHNNFCILTLPPPPALKYVTVHSSSVFCRGGWWGRDSIMVQLTIIYALLFFLSKISLHYWITFSRNGHSCIAKKHISLLVALGFKIFQKTEVLFIKNIKFQSR